MSRSKMLTTIDAAAALGKTRRQVLKLISQGRLRATRFGKAWQVDPASVEAYKEFEHKPGWTKGRKRKEENRPIDSQIDSHAAPTGKTKGSQKAS